MTEHEQEVEGDAPAGENAPEGTAGADTGDGSDDLAPAEDADNPGGSTAEQHVSSVTDLPEGAEVDPLTDQGPQPVVERETHDG